MLSRTLKVALPLALAMLHCLSACNGNGDALQHIQSQGELKVATRNSPTTYFTDRDGPNGFEYALAGMLADDLGVELKVELAFTLNGLFEILQAGRGRPGRRGINTHRAATKAVSSFLGVSQADNPGRLCSRQKTPHQGKAVNWPGNGRVGQLQPRG